MECFEDCNFVFYFCEFFSGGEVSGVSINDGYFFKFFCVFFFEFVEKFFFYFMFFCIICDKFFEFVDVNWVFDFVYYIDVFILVFLGVDFFGYSGQGIVVLDYFQSFFNGFVRVVVIFNEFVYEFWNVDVNWIVFDVWSVFYWILEVFFCFFNC